MKLLDVLDYAEAHPEEWFAQIIENAWSEEDVRRFAAETKKTDFERIRQARNEQHAAACSDEIDYGPLAAALDAALAQ